MRPSFVEEKAILCEGTNRPVHAIFWKPELHQSNCCYGYMSYNVVIVQEWWSLTWKTYKTKIGRLAFVWKWALAERYGT